MLVISCHADTGFKSHSLEIVKNGVYKGVLDNYAGVYAVMKAYFSGRFTKPYVRVELTYGEEEDFAGAYKVLETLDAHDVVLVVDVTGTKDPVDVIVEKCANPALRNYLKNTLNGMSFSVYENCPDPVADSDEVDVYSQKCPYTCFVGVPCLGGDYNTEKVTTGVKNIDGVAEALLKIIEQFPAFCELVDIDPE